MPIRCRYFTNLLALLVVALAAQPAVAGTVDKALSQLACERLEDPLMRQRMDGVLRKLEPLCAKAVSPAQTAPSVATTGGPAERLPAANIRVNDVLADDGAPSQVQSETFLARSTATGTLCSAYNDSTNKLERGFIGFSRSTDGGHSWQDRGVLFDPQSEALAAIADPSVVWNPADGYFYFGALITVDGVGMWRSRDDCRTVEYQGIVDTCFMADKPLLSVDAHPNSPFFGRLYVVWTDFCFSGELLLKHSSNGGESWSPPVFLTADDGIYQGAWPASAPNGDLFVGWVRWHGNFETIDIDIVRSDDGGNTFAAVTRPLVGATNPADAAATAQCQRPALAGGIRLLPSPQVVVGPDGVLHVVYSYDPDGPGQGDTVDVFYRRSTDSGTSWSNEVRLNDDATLNDQFFPTLDVSPDGLVAATWYDRRYDPANLLIDYQQRLSLDGGITWLPTTRLSEVSSPIHLAPELAPCYHGDYNKVLATPERVIAQWADDRRLEEGRPDPDVYQQTSAVAVDYLVQAQPERVEVCGTDTTAVSLELPAFQGFAEPVQLILSGVPAAVSTSIVPNPATAGTTATLTLETTAVTGSDWFDLRIDGTAQPSGVERRAGLRLGVAHALPPVPQPSHPPNDAYGVARQPVLEWLPQTGAITYHLEIAEDAAFERVVYTASTAETRHRVGQLLPELGEHFWRLRAANGCGLSAASPASSFRVRSRHYLLLVDQDDLDPDVLPIYEQALAAAGIDYDLWDELRLQTGSPTAEDLQPYPWVLWFSGRTFDPQAGPDAAEQQTLSDWLARGDRCLLLSSQHFLDLLGNPESATFLNEVFGVVGGGPRIDQVSGAGWLQNLGSRDLTPPFPNRARGYDTDASADDLFTDRGLHGGSVKTLALGSQAAFLSFALEGLGDLADRVQVLRTFADRCVAKVEFDSLFIDGFESGNFDAWDASEK